MASRPHRTWSSPMLLPVVLWVFHREPWLLRCRFQGLWSTRITRRSMQLSANMFKLPNLSSRNIDSKSISMISHVFIDVAVFLCSYASGYTKKHMLLSLEAPTMLSLWSLTVEFVMALGFASASAEKLTIFNSAVTVKGSWKLIP